MIAIRLIMVSMKLTPLSSSGMNNTPDPSDLPVAYLVKVSVIQWVTMSRPAYGWNSGLFSAI